MRARALSPAQPYVACLGRYGLHLEYAMLTAIRFRNAAYVGPFDRICLGLGARLPRNYRLEEAPVILPDDAIRLSKRAARR